MADVTPATTDLPAVKLKDFEADREHFADAVWKATTYAVAGIVTLLVLLAIFLL
jgi:hypothetical protein